MSTNCARQRQARLANESTHVNSLQESPPISSGRYCLQHSCMLPIQVLSCLVLHRASRLSKPVREQAPIWYGVLWYLMAHQNGGQSLRQWFAQSTVPSVCRLHGRLTSLSCRFPSNAHPLAIRKPHTSQLQGRHGTNRTFTYTLSLPLSPLSLYPEGHTEVGGPAQGAVRSVTGNNGRCQRARAAMGNIYRVHVDLTAD